MTFLFRRCLGVWAVGLMCSFSGTLRAEGDWQEVKSANDIEVYFGAYADSKIPQFRVTAIMDVPILAIMEVLRDTESCSQWVHQCRTGILLQEIDEFSRYVYQINDLPFPFKKRDLIVLASLQVLEESREYKISLDAAPEFCLNRSIPECQAIRNNDYIRITQATGFYHIKELENGKVNWFGNSMLIRPYHFLVGLSTPN